MAPVLAVILAGVVSLSSMYAAKLEAKARARRLAWLQADGGHCVPAACSTPSCVRSTSELRETAARLTSSPGTHGFSLRSLLGRIESYFLGSVTRAVASAGAPLPPFISGGRTIQRGAAALPCNATVRRTESGRSALDHACATRLADMEYAREICR